MARKRQVNTMVLLTIIGLVGLIGLGIAWYFRRPVIDYFFPEEPAEFEKRADAQFEAGDYQKAARNYGIAAYWYEKNDDKDGLDRAELQMSRAQLRLALTGKDLVDTERREHYGQAKLRLRRLLLRSPEYVDARQLLCEVSWGEAARQQRAAAWETFVDEATRLLEAKPGDHEMVFRRGLANAQLALARRGKYVDAAEADFRQAIEMALKVDADPTAYWVRLAGFLRWRGRADQADKLYQEALNRAPDNAQLRVSYSAFLRAEDRSDEGLKQLRLAIEKKPDDPLGYIALAAFYRAENEPEKAMKALTDAKRVDDSDFRTYGEMAAILTQQKKPQEAVDTLREGLAALDRRAASRPATQRAEQERIRTARAQLTSMLGNSLLDMAEVQQPPQAAPLQEQAKECLGSLAELAPETALWAKLAGRLALTEGKVDEALELLERSYEGSDRLDAKTVSLLVNLYLRKGLRGKAEAILDRILRVNRNATTLVAKALLLAEYRQYTRAEELLRDALKLDPKHAEARNLLLALRAADRSGPLPDELKATPKVVRLLLDRAGALLLADQVNEAVQLLEELSKKTPTNVPVVGRLVNLHMATGQKNKAKAILRRAIAAGTEQADEFKLMLQAVDATPQQRLAMQMAQADKIEDKLEKAMAKATISAMFRMPEQYVKFLNEAAAIEPNDPRVVAQLFRQGLTTQNWTLAEEQLAKAKASNLDGCQGRLYAAELASARGDWVTTISELEEALKTSPETKQGWALLGQSYLRTGDTENAERAFTAAVEADPGYAPAVVGMARVTEVQEKPREHAAWVDRAYRLAPQHPYIRDRRLQLMEESERTEEVIKGREQILRQSPGDMRNRLRLAGLYEKVNRLQDAEAMYRTFYTSNVGKPRDRARALGAFYARQRRFGEVDSIYAKLLEDTRDDAEKVGAYLDYGWLLAIHNEDLAEKAFRKAIEVEEKDPRGHLALGRFLGDRRRWLEAADAISRYLDLRPEDQRAQKDRVRYLTEAGRFDEASRHLRKIMAEDPADVEAVTLKGLLAMRKGDLEAAEESLNQALSEDPTHVPARVYRAQLYLFQGQHAKARADLESARQRTTAPEILMPLGRLYLGFRDYDSAGPVFKKILEDREDYLPAIDGLVAVYMNQRKWRDLEPLLARAKKAYPSTAGFYLAEAQMWRSRNDLRRTAEALANAFKLAPQTPHIVRNYLISLLGTRQYNQVLADAQPYANKEGFGPWVAAISAHALFKLNRQGEADKLFLSAVAHADREDIALITQQLQAAYGQANAINKMSEWQKLRAKDGRLHLVLGELQVAAGQARRSIPLYRRAFELMDKAVLKAWAKFRLGVVQYQVGSIPEAIQAFEEARKLDPENLETLNNLAYLYTDQLNKPKEALPYAEEAFKRMPNNSNVLDTYAWTLAKLGQYEKAERSLNRALQLGEARATTVYHLGWVYEKSGRITRARQRYEQALEMARAAKDKTLQATVTKALERLKGREAGGREE